MSGVSISAETLSRTYQELFGGPGASTYKSPDDFDLIFAEYGIRSRPLSTSERKRPPIFRQACRVLVPPLLAVALGMTFEGETSTAAAPPPPILPEPRPTPIPKEKEKPVEIPKLGETIIVSDFSEGEGGRKIKEKRAIDSCEGEEGIWGIVWHQLVAKRVETEEGSWYENFSQVCVTTVKETETQEVETQTEVQVLAEWPVGKEKGEQAQEISPRFYHDLRSNKAVFRDSISEELVELTDSEVAATMELGLGWSEHPVVVPNGEEFSVYYGASRNELSEMPRIYRQNISPEGRLAGVPVEVGNSEALRELYPSVVVVDGNHFVFWEQDYEKCPGAFEIWMKIYDFEGRELSNTVPVSLMPYSQHPKAVLLKDKILVTYEYPYIDDSGRPQVEIWGQYLTRQGKLLDGAFPLVQDGKDQNGVYDIAVNERGEAVLVWPASDGEIWGELIEEEGLGPIQKLAEEEGKLMVQARVAAFDGNRFLISAHKFRPWEYLDGEAFGLVVEARNSARSVLEELPATKVGLPVIPPSREKRLVASEVFSLSGKIGEQFTSVSGGKDSALFAWEDGYHRTRNPNGSRILARFATP